ncbi:MAG: hypothetical protein AABO57_05905 [Acidobacteriota bacterium]
MQLDGYFNATGEPAIQLDLGFGQAEILIDTGFAGWLIVPTGFAIDLSDAFEGFQNFLTATGQTFTAVVYFVEIDWFNERIDVPVAVSHQITEALLGGQMLSDCLLSIDYYDRTVKIVRRTSQSD